MKHFILLLSLIFSTNVFSSEFGLVIGSHHFKEHVIPEDPPEGLVEKYDESNPGIYYISDSKIVLSVFENSYKEPVVLGGYVWTFDKGGIVEYSFSAGLVYGYSWNGGKYSQTVYGDSNILPFVYPGIKFHINKSNVRLNYIINAVTLTMGWSL